MLLNIEEEIDASDSPETPIRKSEGSTSTSPPTREIPVTAKVEVNDGKAFLLIVALIFAGVYIIYSNLYLNLDTNYRPCHNISEGIEWKQIRDKFDGLQSVSKCLYTYIKLQKRRCQATSLIRLFLCLWCPVRLGNPEVWG